MLQIKLLNADLGKYGLYYNQKRSLSFTKKNYLAALPYLKGEKNEKGKELKKPNFVTLIESAFEDLHQHYTPEIFIGLMKECAMLQEEAEQILNEDVILADPTTDLSIDQILSYFPEYQRSDMDILMSIATQEKGTSNPIWLMIIAPPSTGKTFKLERFNHPSLSYMLDDFTANALAPGRPNKDAAEVESVFERACHKNLIINDLSSVMSQSEDKVKSFIGSLTAAYGLRYRKASPGGLVDIETDFNFIAGVTPATYQKHKKIMAELGARVLFMWFTPPPTYDFKYTSVITPTELTDHVSGYCLEIMKTPLDVEIPHDVYNYLKEMIHYTIQLRNLRWSRNDREVEGQSRLENQGLSFVKAHARLWKRKLATIEDVDLFLPLIYETIPYEEHLLKIDEGISITYKNNQTKAILNNAIKFHMVDDYEEQITNYHYAKDEKRTVIHYTWKAQYNPIMTYLKQYTYNTVYEAEDHPAASTKPVLTNEFGDEIPASSQQTLM
jgi:hypothetical protein